MAPPSWGVPQSTDTAVPLTGLKRFPAGVVSRLASLFSRRSTRCSIDLWREERMASRVEGEGGEEAVGFAPPFSGRRRRRGSQIKSAAVAVSKTAPVFILKRAREGPDGTQSPWAREVGVLGPGGNVRLRQQNIMKVAPANRRRVLVF